MQTTKRIGRLGVTALGVLVPTLLLSGCGGGGSSIPTNLTGTYSGRYLFTSENVGGDLILRVQGNGRATCVFDEDTGAELNASGTVNSNGQISLKSTITRNSQTATITVTGQAESSRATGQIVLDLPSERDTGAFSLTKTSSSSTASALQSETSNTVKGKESLGEKLDRGIKSTTIDPSLSPTTSVTPASGDEAVGTLSAEGVQRMAGKTIPLGKPGTSPTGQAVTTHGMSLDWFNWRSWIGSWKDIAAAKINNVRNNPKQFILRNGLKMAFANAGEAAITEYYRRNGCFVPDRPWWLPIPAPYNMAWPILTAAESAGG